MPSIKIDRVAHNRECEIQRNVGDIESIGEYTDHQQELDIKRDRTLTDSLVCVGVCWCVRAREMREKCEEHQHQPRRGPQSRTCLSFSRAFRCGRAAESNLAALSLEIRASSRHIERPRWAGLHRARYRQPAANSLGGSENWSAVRIQHRSLAVVRCDDQHRLLDSTEAPPRSCGLLLTQDAKDSCRCSQLRLRRLYNALPLCSILMYALVAPLARVAQ